MPACRLCCGSCQVNTQDRLLVFFFGCAFETLLETEAVQVGAWGLDWCTAGLFGWLPCWTVKLNALALIMPMAARFKGAALRILRGFRTLFLPMLGPTATAATTTAITTTISTTTATATTDIVLQDSTPKSRLAIFGLCCGSQVDPCGAWAPGGKPLKNNPEPENPKPTTRKPLNTVCCVQTSVRSTGPRGAFECGCEFRSSWLDKFERIRHDGLEQVRLQLRE